MSTKTTIAVLVVLLAIIMGWIVKLERIGQEKNEAGNQEAITQERAQKKPDQYTAETYLVSVIYNGPIHDVDFESKPEAKKFRAKINEAMKGGVNFAGKYVVASWGCGTSCQSSAIIDAETGVITQYGIGSEYGLSFKKESRLLVVNPPENVMDLAAMPIGIQSEWYEMRDGMLTLLERQDPIEME